LDEHTSTPLDASPHPDPRLRCGCEQGEGIGEQAQRWLGQLHALTEDGRPSHKHLRRLVDGWSARQQGGLLRFHAAAVLRAPWMGAAADAMVEHPDAVVELQVHQN
jgi:hypothetical protein